MARKILIVDDEPLIIELVRKKLELSGFSVVSASDGEEGFLKLQNEKPDLLLLDVMIPKLDGYTFVRKMKHDETVAHIPVIILTAKDKMQDLFELEGVKSYLVKPFKAEELLEKISLELSTAK